MTRLICFCAAFLSTAAPAATMWDRFLDPPADARPMVRWWWFGPAVTDEELDREIRAMKAGGFGGFEVQPTYPLTPDDPAANRVNIPYLSDAFIARLAHAGATARREGMRIDVTLGTGWPFGGPHVPVTEASEELREIELPVAAGRAELRLPVFAAGERPIAAFLGDRRLPLAEDGISRGRATAMSMTVKVPVAAAPRKLRLYVAGRTGQQVKRAAVGGEGYVMDHVDSAAVGHHLAAVGDRLLQAFPKNAPPYAMFSDSLEAYGASWTGDLPAEFRRRRGYDLLDHLPALFADGPESPAVRYDWALTLSELLDERYLAPVEAWTAAHGTRFRAQVYGFPPPTLSSNALVALPEGEGADWRGFNSTRWATSAAHLYGKPVVSSETGTWLHSPAWAATPLDMKVEADRHFLQGINQLIGHGWPYSPPGMAEPGWAFYAAASFNDHNPWYPAMPAVTRYLARVSAMLREGHPANPVAIYLPTEDAFAGMTPANASANRALQTLVPEVVTGQVLDAGYGFDFIDARAVAAGRLSAKLLVLPPMRHIDAAAYRAIARWAKEGGKVLAVGQLPSLSGGLVDGPAATRAVADVNRALFSRSERASARLIAAGEIGATLHRMTPPDVALARPDPSIGFVHRRIEGGDLYFLVNTGNVPVATSARFAGDTGKGAWWDPLTGTAWAAGTGKIPILLAPYEARFLTFTRDARDLPPARTALRAVADLSNDWGIELPGRAARTLGRIAPWTLDESARHVSGSVTYRRIVDLPAVPGGRVSLDFGETTPVRGPSGARPRALVLAPVREAALVEINGKPAGTLWAPPYRVDVTGLLRSGRNEIVVKAMNTALNALAARGGIDQRLLKARYGDRFTDQDQELIAPQPSGLLGPVRLLADR